MCAEIGSFPGQMVCGPYKVWRMGIVDGHLRDRLWEAYDEIFAPINKATPIMQSYSREEFEEFMHRGDVVKVVAAKDDDIAGLGMIFNDLSLDPWLSQEYFREHFDGPVYYIPALAVREGERSSQLAIRILRTLINEVPDHGYGVFDHSMGVNPFIPKLAELAGRGKIQGRVLDQKSVVAYGWVNGVHVDL